MFVGETTLPNGSYDAEPVSEVAPDVNVPTMSLCRSVRASTPLPPDGLTPITPPAGSYVYVLSPSDAIVLSAPE